MKCTLIKILGFFILISLSQPIIDGQSVSNKHETTAFITPLNQRLDNSLCNFAYSKYIDHQMRRFMLRTELVGVSVAVVKNEKLVYVKGFGYANLENSVEVSPAHVFRIASVSKLITAVAIMKMVEDSLLTLNDKVFGETGIFNDSAYQKIKDPKLKDITIKHMLNHTSGWSQRYGDPMFVPLSIARKMGVEPPVTVDTYIKYVINRRLSYRPGSAYSYSNMAYVFLGEIIKRKSGMSYEDYVKYKVLAPMGITDMHIGHSLEKDKLDNEVTYYEQKGSLQVRSFDGSNVNVPKSYGGNYIELLGPAGGWVASAAELAKFLTNIDGFNKVPDFLSSESVDIMTKQKGNPLGWKDAYGGYWVRTGSYAGTAAMLKRMPDGTEWVFIANTSSWKGPYFSKDINYFMNKIMRKVKKWPNFDLFHHYNYNISSN